MKKFIILLIILSIFSGCSYYNKERISRKYNKGTIVQNDFFYRIPFKYEHGFIMITVNIENDNYNFVFDTGAPTLISYELFEKLNYRKYNLPGSIRDSQGNIGHASYTDIPELNIGELTYKNISSLIIDLRKNQVYDCRNIDGLFGANHMSKAIWAIDYEKQEIIVTNDLKNLNLPEPYYAIDFFTEQNFKTPKTYQSSPRKAVFGNIMYLLVHICKFH